MPVVASRAGALPEVVNHGETGLLCNPDEPAEFAHSILRLLGDRPLARTTGQAGRERVQRLFQWGRAAQMIVDQFEEAVRRWTDD